MYEGLVPEVAFATHPERYPGALPTAADLTAREYQLSSLKRLRLPTVRWSLVVRWSGLRAPGWVRATAD